MTMATRLFLILFLLTTALCGAQPVITLGVCPFEDQTGTPAGEQVAKLMPLMFLYKGSTTYRVVLLNPGPMPDYDDTAWPAEVGRMNGVDAVIIGHVRAVAQGKSAGMQSKTNGSVVSLDTAKLVMEATLVDASGKKLRTITTDEAVKGFWFKDAAGYFTGIHFDPPKFGESQLGKAVNHSIESIQGQIAGDLKTITAKTSLAKPAAGTCAVTFRVLFTEKQKASKAYEIAVNRKEESLGIRDGALTKELPSGEAQVRIVLRDPPFRQAVQEVYYINPLVDCSKVSNTLVLEVGASGEGVPLWK
jgi:hypothetical protein